MFQNRELQTKYFDLNIKSLPHHYTSNETIRMTLGMFCLSALEMLGSLTTDYTKKEKEGWIEWIYDQQHETKEYSGFSGAPFLGLPRNIQQKYDLPHITMTYSAIVSLLILKDDLNRIKKSQIVQLLKKLQQEDGSFCPVIGSDEKDMRFVYCACAISYILDDFSGIDIVKTKNYILSCQNYDGGFGIQKNLESHGGTTYCAIASLKLLDKLDEMNKSGAIHWLVSRQDFGFHGRVNKPDDTCYAYWICGSLQVIFR